MLKKKNPPHTEAAAATRAHVISAGVSRRLNEHVLRPLGIRASTAAIYSRQRRNSQSLSHHKKNLQQTVMLLRLH